MRADLVSNAQSTPVRITVRMPSQVQRTKQELSSSDQRLYSFKPDKATPQGLSGAMSRQNLEGQDVRRSRR